MLKVIRVVHKLVWLSADTIKLKFHFIFNYFFGVIQGLLTFFTPFALSEMVNSITHDNHDKILLWFWILTVMTCCLVASKFITRFFFEYLSRIIPIKLKEKYYEKLIAQTYTWHVNNSAGYFLTILNRVANIIKTWLWAMNFSYIPSLTFSIVFCVYTYIRSPMLFWYLAMGGACFVLLTRIFYSRRIEYTNNASVSENSFDKAYTDFIYNVRSVKKMNLLSFVLNTLNVRSGVSFDRNKKLMRYNALQWGFTEMFLSLLFLLPTGIYIYSYLKTGQNIDMVVMLVAVQGNIQSIGREFMHLMTELANNKIQTDILDKHLKDLKSINDKVNKSNPRSWNKIEFKNTCFKFTRGGTGFVSRINNIVINRGDHIAITGVSGQGKSTFLNLLTRQFNVQSGEICIDGIPYDKLSDNFFNTKMTYVSQDVELFNMSLYDNITLGRKISKKQLQDVLSGCCLQELVGRMNGDLTKNIGEKGIRVSGGERQRINLARGLLLDRDILILDEITANLDPETTKKIWKYIFDKYRDKTIIAISHTPELLSHVNKTIYFNNGIGDIMK